MTQFWGRGSRCAGRHGRLELVGRSARRLVGTSAGRHVTEDGLQHAASNGRDTPPSARISSISDGSDYITEAFDFATGLPEAAMGLTVDFWPLFLGLALAAVATAFRYSERLHRDTGGLV